ncbi:MAG TPA: Ig-like domain-containing protein [Terriglobales bacterium]|nr:Ig-like domain-containing protein [Terriglobales bacterium]
MKKVTAIFAIISLSLGLAACGSGGASSSNTNTPPPVTASLTSLQVAPGNASVAPGAVQQFTATGKYSDGSSKDLTGSAQWKTSDSNIASVAGGKVTGVGAGIAMVTATSGKFSASATLRVNSAATNLASIAVSPAASSLPVNTSQQFTATGTYKDGSSRDLTALVSWASSFGSIATVDVSGVATGMSAGSTTISASLGGITGSTSLTVTAPTISSIVITPDGLTLGIGIGEQYTATAIYSDGSTQDLVSGVTWSSSATGVATINSSGLATTVGAGTATITAKVGSFTDSTLLTVVAANLVSISVTPTPVSIAIGTDQQFSAVGSFNDGSTQLLTSVTWTSSSSSVATVNSAGLATAVGTGSATITASSGSVNGTAALTVTGATVTSIAVTPANSNMPVGTTKQFTATATFSDSSTEDVTAVVLWGSSKPGVASISNQGLLTSVATGSTTISAVLGSVTGTTSLTVTTVKLVGIAILPSNPRIEAHTLLKFTAVGTFSDGSTGSNLAGVSWKSSTPRVASLRSSGTAFGKKTGSATITASASGLKGTTTLTVSNGTLVSLAITPANSTVSNGSKQQFTATGTFSDSTTQDITMNVHWSSSHASVATIANAPSTAGLATTAGVGSTTIGANSGGITNSTSLTVQ